MMDNLAFQRGTGNWLIQEDGDQLTGNNDVWACMDDGQDADLLSDSCIRIATLNDLAAEWTGGVFTSDGKRLLISVQHNVTGTGVVLEITGWK
jgi:secreted PhoX family phosphatase